MLSLFLVRFCPDQFYLRRAALDAYRPDIAMRDYLLKIFRRQSDTICWKEIFFRVSLSPGIMRSSSEDGVFMMYWYFKKQLNCVKEVLGVVV